MQGMFRCLLQHLTELKGLDYRRMDHRRMCIECEIKTCAMPNIAKPSRYSFSVVNSDYSPETQVCPQESPPQNPFGLVRLRPTCACVNCAKNRVKVKAQELPFRALKLLLSRPNEIVTREEFRPALWPADVFVDF